ncbi:MAG: glycosyltransferase family 39 protein [Elusimicrobia bacterium]|nr:glycosyltransferase family 39 protein [Elusimicrobiota bacterium]
MRRSDAAALFLLCLGAASLLARLGSVPALSLDEAWIGNFSQQLRAQGPFTPHQMNHYTGPLFAWAMAGVTAARGFGVESVRLFGAALNAAALIGLWLHLRRRVSPEAGATWALLAAGSAYFLMKSRLAWEVYALQPALILGTLSLLADRGAAGFGQTAALTALTLLGVQNHFIYLSVPASLVMLFGARAAWRNEREALGGLRAAACALAAGGVFAAIKHSIGDAAWNAHRGLFFAALLGAPALAAAATWRLPANALLFPFARARAGLSVTFGLTISAFAIWHWAPLVQVLAGPVVFKRLFAYALPLPAGALLHAWGIFLAGALAWRAVRAWHGEPMSFHERTLLLWPAAFAAVFIAFRHTSSLRYYSLPWTISAVALAAGLPRFAAADRTVVYRCAAVAALATQALLWREILSPADRAPLSFQVGWRRENSRDFARKEALFAAYDASGACHIAHAERSFSAVPLSFHRSERPQTPCDPALAFDADQCRDCAAAPFYRWAVVPAEK